MKRLICLCALGALVGGCCEPAKENATPKHQGKDYTYYSPGAQGYGAPHVAKKAQE